jgi:hypothetical protein
VKIVVRLTKGESKKKRRNKSHEASYIVVEVGGTSTFVTHDVTKVEVRWAETHLKLKSHAPKERGRLTPRNSVGLSAAWDRAGPCGPGAGPGPGPSRWGPRVPAGPPTWWVCGFLQNPPTCWPRWVYGFQQDPPTCWPSSWAN